MEMSRTSQAWSPKEAVLSPPGEPNVSIRLESRSYGTDELTQRPSDWAKIWFHRGEKDIAFDPQLDREVKPHNAILSQDRWSSRIGR